MEFGVHLPLMDFGGHPFSFEQLARYTTTAAELGFDTITANDHLVFTAPWLDGLTALASMIERSASMTLATTVALPVVRGPVVLAKALAAIDRLSGGRLVVGLGPGSSAADYDAVDIDFSERWARFDESVAVLRSMWRRDEPPFVGRYYSADGIVLDPPPVRSGGPPIWIGSWGSAVGLARVARLADGWLASAYNTTPEDFATARRALEELTSAAGRGPDPFPNALSTMWFHVTEDRVEAARIVRERVAPVVHRPESVLRERLPIGPAEQFAELLTAFESAGVERVYLWPVADEAEQLERFWNDVRPLVGQGRETAPT